MSLYLPTRNSDDFKGDLTCNMLHHTAEDTRNSFHTQEVQPSQSQNSLEVKLASSSDFPIGITSLDIDKSTNLRINAYVDPLTPESIKVHLNTWGDTILHSASCTWLEICKKDRDLQCGRFSTFDDQAWEQPKGNISRKITFTRSYAAPPQVIVWLSQLDFCRESTAWRINAYASDVTADTFIIHIDTWLDTVLHGATVSWIASPSDRSNIASGSYFASQVPSRQQGQLSTQGTAYFGKTFQRAPRVWAALSRLDIGNEGNLRTKLRTSNISTTGMMWSLDGWDDTVVYDAGASYIAIQDF